MNTIKDMLRVTLFGSDNAASRNGAPAFDPERDIPSLAGKTILITGAAGDLGRQTTIELIRYGRPKRIYIADLPQSDEAKQALINRINDEAYGHSSSEFVHSDNTPYTDIRFLELDLASFESVRRCAAEFTKQERHLDILILNAGIIRVIPRKTQEGYEAHFGINYLGHALLARLLTPVLLRTASERGSGDSTADVRIIIVSSEGYLFAPKKGVDFDLVRTDCAKMPYSKRYGQSKLALIGLMKTLSRAHPQIKCVAIHPGRILTGMARGLQEESTLAWVAKPIAQVFCVPVSTGIRNHLWAATSGDVASGNYYEPVGVPATLSGVAADESFVTRLHEWTDEALEGVDTVPSVEE